MRRLVLLPVFVALAALGLNPPGHAREPSSQGNEDAVYVYDLFLKADNCLELFGRLRRLPLRAMVILSIEQGPDFILDQPRGEEKLRCVLRFLNGSERRVKALFLQDHGFLRDGPEAARRAALLGDFVTRYPGEFAGVQIDVEPHADETWEASRTEERRLLLEGLHELLRQIRPGLAGLPLGVAVPWWYADLAPELPEAAPGALFHVADELYVMLYGDETDRGAWDSSRMRNWFGRVPATPPSARIHFVLATYEFGSKAELQRKLREIRRALDFQDSFGGTAVFHAGSRFRTTLSSRLSMPVGSR